jgi:hypothetical protein
MDTTLDSTSNPAQTFSNAGFVSNAPQIYGENGGQTQQFQGQTQQDQTQAQAQAQQGGQNPLDGQMAEEQDLEADVSFIRSCSKPHPRFAVF